MLLLGSGSSSWDHPSTIMVGTVRWKLWINGRWSPWQTAGLKLTDSSNQALFTFRSSQLSSRCYYRLVETLCGIAHLHYHNRHRQLKDTDQWKMITTWDRQLGPNWVDSPSQALYTFPKLLWIQNLSWKRGFEHGEQPLRGKNRKLGLYHVYPSQ